MDNPLALGKRKTSKEIKYAVILDAQFVTLIIDFTPFELNYREIFSGKLSLCTGHIDGFPDIKTLLLYLSPHHATKYTTRTLIKAICAEVSKTHEK